MKQKTTALGMTLVASLVLAGQTLCAASRPNVIVIMADDQGYGDVRAHGHPFIRTPNMDKLHAESVRFTDFHVAPMCTPTRGQLLTGVDAMKNGATAVCQGRSMMRRDIPTLANYFGDAGYKTIISGKWHLGDSYPHRPEDRGFEEVLSFRAWGLPSLASHWANSFINAEESTDSYHDPVLAHNGEDKRFRGYVTDILFDHAMEQIEACDKANDPFFLYLPTPTPHTPNISPKEKLPYYQALGAYEGKRVHADYYGMIENIDDNLGRLEQFLVDREIKDNTILVYLSDNGTQSSQAAALYNAGMRAKKTSVYEGGHRVPCFVRWPGGKLKHGRDVCELTQVQDLCPTLLGLCGVKPANLYAQSGHDLSPLLKDKAWPNADRVLFVQYRVEGASWTSAVAMQGPWRLVGGKELYNIEGDPGQAENVAAKYPERLASLDKAYGEWHTKAHVEFMKTRYIDLGHPKASSTILYASDWEGSYCDNPGGLQAANGTGSWHVDVVQPGRYRIELSRWPFESGKALAEGTDPQSKHQRGARPIAAANLQIADGNYTLDAAPDALNVPFCVKLPAGKTQLRTHFMDAEDRTLCSAIYTRVTRLGGGEGTLTPRSNCRPKDNASVKQAKPAKTAKSPTAKVVKLAAEDLLIADFEGTNYGDWTVEGTAFGAGPARDLRVTSHQGRGIVDTYISGGGDKLVGKLSSPGFKIERRCVNFMIGGGSHAGMTCVNLLIDGKVVRSATGTASKDSRGKKVMRWVSWNVAAFKGQTAQIEIVDDATGGWGHIVVDYIFQSDRAVTSVAMR